MTSQTVDVSAPPEPDYAAQPALNGHSISLSRSSGECWTSFPTRHPNDAPPSWPICPFDETSKTFRYENWAVHSRRRFDLLVRNVHDPRRRFEPSHQDVASFYRHDIDFNPYGPDWNRIRLILMQNCSLSADQLQSLDVPSIIDLLDQLNIHDELRHVSAAIGRMASQIARIEKTLSATGEVTAKERDVRWQLEVAIRDSEYRIMGVLLKTHALPQQLNSLAQAYPGCSRKTLLRSLSRIVAVDCPDEACLSSSGILSGLGSFIQKECGSEPPRLVVYPAENRAVLDDVSYRLEPKQTEILERMARNPGWISGRDLGCKRPDRLIRGAKQTSGRHTGGMPAALQEVIESKKPNGYRLRLHARIQ